MNVTTHTIRLELDTSGDCLTGRASDGTGATRDFNGWLGLLAAIDALLGAEPTEEPADDPE